jgi:hypothetical protein
VVPVGRSITSQLAKACLLQVQLRDAISAGQRLQTKLVRQRARKGVNKATVQAVTDCLPRPGEPIKPTDYVAVGRNGADLNAAPQASGTRTVHWG